MSYEIEEFEAGDKVEFTRSEDPGVRLVIRLNGENLARFMRASKSKGERDWVGWATRLVMERVAEIKRESTVHAERA